MRKYEKSTNNNCCFQDRCKRLENDTQWFAEKINKGSPPKSVQVLFLDRNSDMIVVAPHGGKIEPGTEEIAGMVAHELGCSCYCFCSGHRKEERKDPGGEDGHHIDSTEIKARHLQALVKGSDIAISIHGLSNSKSDRIEVGGTNQGLLQKIVNALNKQKCPAQLATNGSVEGTSAKNFINRYKNRGVQLEIPLRPYRVHCAGEERRRLAEAVASVLRDELQALNQQGSP